MLHNMTACPAHLSADALLLCLELTELLLSSIVVVHHPTQRTVCRAAAATAAGLWHRQHTDVRPAQGQPCPAWHRLLKASSGS